jgi:NADPH:quinone reductase-like Zn-dependent oxidoreductase
MKAAVLHQLGVAPKYEDFPDPVPQNDNQVVITVKAASIKNLDKGRASGAHYAPHTKFPDVVGVDGLGLLADGKRVYAMGLTGMIAEKALADKSRLVAVPDGIDDVTAAALPNAILGAALALKYRAALTPGKVVLVNGATGVTGKLAVQLAKYYGAARVIVTGRNATSLQQLTEQLGADEALSLSQDEASFVSALKAIHAKTPIDIVIDYIWGTSVEWILHALKGGGLHIQYHPIRIVTVGNMSGDNLNLGSAQLRSSAIEIVGSGFGSLPPEAFAKMNTEVIPELMQLAAGGGLRIDTHPVPLKDVEQAWNSHVEPGTRIVITM